MDVLNNDKILLVIQNGDKADTEFIGISHRIMINEYEPTLKLIICSKEESWSLIPIMNCPNFKHKYYYFNDTDLNYDNHLGFSIFVMLFIKYEGVIKYEKIRNQIFDFDQEDNCELNKSDCYIKNWSWKPNIVKNFSELQLKNVYNAIKNGLISSNVNQFWIWRYFFKGGRYLMQYFHDSEEFKNILKLLNMGEKTSIAFHNLWIGLNNKKSNIHTKLTLESKHFIFSFGGKIYKAYWDYFEIKLKGLIYEPKNKKQVIVVKWDYFNTYDLVITYENDISCFQPDWYDRFPDDDSAPNKLWFYVVLNKNEITSLFFYRIDFIKNKWIFPKLQNVIIKATEEDFEKEEFIDALKYIQKSITLRIKWDKDSWFLTNESFWIMLFKFKKVELDYVDYYEIQIDWQNQKLNQTDILKSKVITNYGLGKNAIEIGQITYIFKNFYNKSNYIDDDDDNNEEDDIDYNNINTVVMRNYKTI